MLQPSSLKATEFSFLQKVVDCLFVSIALVDIYNTMVLYPLLTMVQKSGIATFLKLMNPILILAGILFTILYPIYWKRKEISAHNNIESRHNLLRGIIRYWLALSICTPGFGKILQVQFTHSFFRDDSLVRNLSGYDLTWSYFGHSYGMAVVIAALEIGGSLMLLFRRTSFLGIAILLPVMLNIVLIDFFYQISYAAFTNALLLTLGLIYLFLLRWNDVKRIIFPQSISGEHDRFVLAKYFLRGFVVLYAFGFIYYFTTTKSPKVIIGKWRIDQLIKNGDTLRANSWMTDSADWKTIYLEQYGGVTLNPNPYVIDEARSLRGIYEFNSATNKIKLMVSERGAKIDTLDFIVHSYDNSHMQWKSISSKENLLLELSKLN